MGIFFLLSAGVCIAFAFMLMRKRRVDSVFAAAAKQLGLSWASDGALSVKSWIYGFKEGYRIDVRPFRASQDTVNPLWTGYRLAFRNPIEMSFSGSDDPRRRALAKMSELFRESEVDTDGLFCARASLPHDPAILVKEVQFLIQMARLFERAVVGETDLESSIAVEEEVEVPVTPPPLPRPRPITQEKQPDATPEPPEAKSPEPEPAPPPKERELSPVEIAAIDLFGQGRNRYETDQYFASTFKGETLEGRGVLRKIGRYSNDRYFGRGPGFLAEIQVACEETDQSLAVSTTLTLELLSAEPETRDQQLDAWRSLVGRPVMIIGTAIHCDPFSRKIVLRRGEIESAESGE